MGAGSAGPPGMCVKKTQPPQVPGGAGYASVLGRLPSAISPTTHHPRCRLGRRPSGKVAWTGIATDPCGHSPGDPWVNGLGKLHVLHQIMQKGSDAVQHLPCCGGLRRRERSIGPHRGVRTLGGGGLFLRDREGRRVDLHGTSVAVTADKTDARIAALHGPQPGTPWTMDDGVTKKFGGSFHVTVRSGLRRSDGSDGAEASSERRAKEPVCLLLLFLNRTFMMIPGFRAVPPRSPSTSSAGWRGRDPHCPGAFVERWRRPWCCSSCR